ncbi:MAG: hypothetical protein RJA07_444 [Bacteroidota bacterium]|jgi:hypothetical protein
MKKIILITEVILSLLIFIGISSCKKNHAASKDATAIVYRYDDSLFHFYADASDGTKIKLDGSNSLSHHGFGMQSKCAQTYYHYWGEFELQSDDSTSLIMNLSFNWGDNSIGRSGMMWEAISTSPPSGYNYSSLRLNSLTHQIKHYSSAKYYQTSFTTSKINGETIGNFKGQIKFYSVDSNSQIIDSLLLSNVDLLYTF